MPEPNHPPLTDDQVIVLTGAIEAWVVYHPDPDYRAFAFAGGEPFSPRELLDALQGADSEIAERFLRMTQFALELEPFDNIVQGFHHGGYWDD